jgi:hypothetical protein
MLGEAAVFQDADDVDILTPDDNENARIAEAFVVHA